MLQWIVGCGLLLLGLGTVTLLAIRHVAGTLTCDQYLDLLVYT